MKTNAVVLTAAGILLAVGAGGGRAESSVRQEIVTGVEVVEQNNPEAKFEEYREIPNGVVIDAYSLTREGEKSSLSLAAQHVQQEDQSANMEFHSPKLSLSLSYDQSPHLWSENAQTLYTEVSPGVFRLPDGMQSTFQANPGTAPWTNMMISTFAGLAHGQELSSRQDKTALGLGYALSEDVSLGLDLSMEKKNGHKLQAMAFGFSHVVEIPKPIDQTVYESNVRVDYALGGTHLSLSHGLSLYQNDINAVIWDSSRKLSDSFSSSGYSTGNQSSQGRLATQPDNRSQTVALSGGTDLPLKSHFTADVSFVQMVQNDDLLPYTINTAMVSTSTIGFDAFDPSILPVKSAGAKNTLWVQNYAVTNQAIKNLTLALKARSEQMGNSSQEVLFASGIARLDQAWSTAPVSTDRFAYRKRTLGVSGDWDPSPWWGLGLDLSRETAIREHREFKETEDNVVTGRLRYRPLGWMFLKARYVRAARKAMELEIEDFENDSGVLIELPGLRRSDIAARDRNAGDLTVQMGGRSLNVSLVGVLSHDKFLPGDGNLANALVAVSTGNQSQMYGLLSSRNARAGIDVSWEATDRVGLFTYYQYEHVIGLQRSNTTNASPPVTQDAANDWTVLSTDRYDVAGVGVDIDVLADVTLSLGYDLAFSRGATDIKEKGSALATKTSPPETKTSKQDFSIKGEYRPRKDLSFELGYLHERYDVSDFATDNVPLVSGSLSGQTNLLLADSLLDYRAHVVAFKVKYAW